MLAASEIPVRVARHPVRLGSEETSCHVQRSSGQKLVCRRDLGIHSVSLPNGREKSIPRGVLPMIYKGIAFFVFALIMAAIS